MVGNRYTGCLFTSLKFEETAFTFLIGVGTAISLWYSEPHERIAVCKAKALPSYLTIRPSVLVLLTKTKPSASNTSPHARESKTVVDSGFHAVESGFRAGTGRLCLSVELGFWIPIVSRIPADSKAQDSGFSKQKFPRFQNLDSLTRGGNLQSPLWTWSR